MSAPEGTTHRWYDASGKPIGWLKVSDWVSYWDEPRSTWTVIGKSLQQIRGSAKPCGKHTGS